MHRNGYLGTSGNTFGRFGDVFRFLHFISWKFAVFLHLVYFTYWAKFEVGIAIHCRVIAFLLLIRRVTIWLWPAFIHGGSRDQPCRNIEDPVPIRSWVVSYNVFNWLLFKMRFRLLRMRRITWPVRWGVNYANIFWNHMYWFVYSLWNFGGFTVKVECKKTMEIVSKSQTFRTL